MKVYCSGNGMADLDVSQVHPKVLPDANPTPSNFTTYPSKETLLMSACSDLILYRPFEATSK
jgi:hypothetical protein